METMHAAGRRKLPPVPRPAADAAGTAVPSGTREEPAAERTLEPRPRSAEPTPADETADDALADDPTLVLNEDQAEELAEKLAEDEAAELAEDLLDPERLAVADEPELALDDDDPAQDFVSRLRAAAADFADAAGAQTAVVREAVPPARHRRSRCRVVLRYPDGAESDLTFLGAIGKPGTPAWQGFDQHITRWLGAGQEWRDAWIVADEDAPDGIALDVPAWLTAG